MRSHLAAMLARLRMLERVRSLMCHRRPLALALRYGVCSSGLSDTREARRNQASHMIHAPRGGQLARSTVVQQPLPIPTLSTESSVMPDPHRKTRPPSRCPGLWVTHPDSWRRTVPVAPILVEIGARRPFFPLGDDWCFLQGAPGRSESAIICCFRGRQGV